MTDPATPDRLRVVLAQAINDCPDNQRGELRTRIQTFAAQLDADDLAIVERAIADIDIGRQSADAAYQASIAPWRQTPTLMANHLEGDNFKLYPHVAYLGEKFRQLDSGEDRFQIWNLPPQHYKSTIAQRGLAWALDRHPDYKYITTSYGDDLADRNGIAVRDYLVDYGEVLRVRLKRDQKRADRFATEAGGGLLAAGLFSGMTGFGATGGIVIDDPFKGWQDAHSAAHRLKVSNTVRSVVFARRSGKQCWILLIMTRWHEADLTQEIVDLAAEIGMQFTVTRLPEIAEAADPDNANRILRLPDPLGRQPGELLCPDLFDEEEVRIKQAFFGSYLAAGLLQQRPAPAAGTEILREWFRLSDTLPPRPDRAITSWDSKLKDKETGDYVVGQVWWRVGGGFWLMDQLRGQYNQATTKAAMALLAVRHPEAQFHHYENKGNAPEVAAELSRSDADYTVSDYTADMLGMTDTERGAVTLLIRRGLSSLRPENPRGEKSVRMRAVSPRIEGGDVYLPAGASWVPGFLDEMAAFPNGTHDDQVDACSQALGLLTASQATLVNPNKNRGPASRDMTRGVAAMR